MMGKRVSRARQALLLAAMLLMIPCYVFTIGNILLAPFTLYERSRVALALTMVLCVIALVWLLRRVDAHEAFFARHERAVLAFAAAFYFTMQLVLGAALRHTPNTDAEQCFTAAQLLVDTGTYGKTPRYFTYFTRYPHNLGLVYLLAGAFRLFGALSWHDRYMQTVLLCALLFVPGLLSAARMTRRLGGVRAQMRLLVLFGSCLPLLYASAELYTDAFSLSFPAMILYCAMRVREEKRARRSLLWMAALAAVSFVGMQLRATSVIALIAAGIGLLLTCRLRRFFATLVLTLCVLAVGGAAVGRLNEHHLTREAIERYKLPVLHYIAMGLPVQVDEGYGQYGDGGWLVFTTSFDDPAERDAALLQEVIDRVYTLRYPGRLLHMLSRKNLSTFGDGSFGLSHLIEADEPEPDNALKQVIFSQGRFHRAYYHLCTGLFLSHMALACAACVQALRRRDARGAPVFIALLGIFLFLCMWETQPRYFFQYEPLLLCAGALLNVPQGGEKKIHRRLT